MSTDLGAVLEKYLLHLYLLKVGENHKEYGSLEFVRGLAMPPPSFLGPFTSLVMLQRIYEPHWSDRQKEMYMVT